jgi:hypothetical protein
LPEKGCSPPRLCVFPSKFAAFHVPIAPPPRPKWTNPRGISNLPSPGTATPRQLAAFPRGKRMC